MKRQFLLGTLATLLATAASGCAVEASDSDVAQVEQEIVGGVEATPGAHPWQARLSIEIDGVGYLCGGSLLNERWILTAAHCLEDKNGTKAKISNVDVFLGDHDVRVPDANEQQLGVAQYIQHESWDASTLKHDIALIQLSAPAVLNDAVQPIELAENTASPGETATASGWGILGWYSQGGVIDYSIGPLLQEVAMPVLSTAQCSFSMSDEKICTGVPGGIAGGRSACQGDSGGPLVIAETDGTERLQGITSYGDGYCQTHSIFTRVTAYRDWILPKIRECYEVTGWTTVDGWKNADVVPTECDVLPDNYGFQEITSANSSMHVRISLDNDRMNGWMLLGKLNNRGRNGNDPVLVLGPYARTWLYPWAPTQADIEIGDHVRVRDIESGQCAYTQHRNTAKHWDCWNGPGQEFEVLGSSGGADQRRLRNVRENQCLSVRDGKLRSWDCWDDPNMRFRFNSVVDDERGHSYQIQHVNTGLCFSSIGGAGSTWDAVDCSNASISLDHIE